MRKTRHITALLLIIFTLFSGQTMAGMPGHKFFTVQSADSLLRHNADSEEIRVTAHNSAEDFRERYRKHLRGTPRLFIH